MKKLELALSPIGQGDNLTIYKSSTNYLRQNFPTQFVRPNGFGYQEPKMPNRVAIEKFCIRLDTTSILNGHRNFITGSSFFVDSMLTGLPESLRRILDTDLDTSIKFIEDKDQFYLHDEIRPDIKIDEEVGICSIAEPSNWGSFLVRAIPKALEFKAEGIDSILIWANHPNQKRLLELLGYLPSQILLHNPKANYKFANGYLKSDPAPGLFLDPCSKNLMQLFASKFYDGFVNKRIYVSRKSKMGQRSGRICVNESDVENLMIKFGFTIVYPETIEVDKQIQIFANADIVVGCSGASMFNCVFCKKNTIVIDIESQPNWLWGHLNLFSSFGLKHYILFAEPTEKFGPAHRPFTVDIKQMNDLLLKIC